MLNYGRSKKFNSTNSIGSLATSTATTRAEATALGKNRGQTSVTPDSAPFQRRTKVMSKGSTAGLQNQKAVRLSANNSGYENPSNQQARNRIKQKKTVQLPSTNAIMNNNSINKSNTKFDMRMTSDKNSSVSKLHKRTGKG